MTKKKILIVEDEPIIAADIEMTLEDLGYIVTGIVDNAEEALQLIDEDTPNLILLDINIEGDIDGIMLAEDINEKLNIPFVYLTSNADKLTINRVKRTNPSGFIVKPFSEKDLQSNIEIALFNQNKNNDYPKVSSDIFVKDGGSFVKIKIDNILFAKADDNYTRVFTVDKNFIISSTLKKFSENINNSIFIRIHRSYIINIKAIERIKDGYLFIGKHKLPIGRNYQDLLFKQIVKL